MLSVRTSPEVCCLVKSQGLKWYKLLSDVDGRSIINLFPNLSPGFYVTAVEVF